MTLIFVNEAACGRPFLLTGGWLESLEEVRVGRQAREGVENDENYRNPISTDRRQPSLLLLQARFTQTARDSHWACSRSTF